jgi:hypothetical protein
VCVGVEVTMILMFAPLIGIFPLELQHDLTNEFRFYKNFEISAYKKILPICIVDYKSHFVTVCYAAAHDVTTA